MLTIRSMQKLARLLLEVCPDKPAYLAMPVPKDSVDQNALLKAIRDLGYYAMFRSTAFGDELVITDVVDNGDSGPPRCQAP